MCPPHRVDTYRRAIGLAMPDDLRALAALHDFIADLRTAFELAGPPTYERLETLSRRYQNADRDGGPRILPLAHSTTHDYLSGKRHRLPPWPWVMSFVLVLRDAAVENALDPEAIGTPAQWHTKYRAVRAALAQSRPPRPPLSAPVPADWRAEPADPHAGDPDPGRHTLQESRPGPKVPASVTDEVDRPSTGTLPRASGPDESSGAGSEPPPEPTIMRRRYAEAFGRTGMRLLRQAEGDEGERQGVPAYRLAALLACADRPAEALYWLRRAARAGHGRAAELAAAWDPAAAPAFPYWQGAEIAYQIGLEYDREGLPFSAAVFYRGAAGLGHADAAYRYGLHCLRIGRLRDAAAWLDRADRNGHPQAGQQLLLHALGGSSDGSPSGVCEHLPSTAPQ
ncbi:Sel1 domain protein repeat-containing protein [Thermomonospora curvata DSM 43183]|uniref:Sel1 domain protein repeat-containing protein n=1 Tax=Thermomonospora curvata (strain ATCC 19995 / DSM 43183 / JCM 3096 / KCTC 9072 / NBRC 15933 / NCIMB 10081 / Henssen B9) TaxID=471852 RepID=D1A7F9_THECD|nr:Sel1 domain protein repeat-containing protein [Thermomonospora curvata DSM 43183]